MKASFEPAEPAARAPARVEEVREEPVGAPTKPGRDWLGGLSEGVFGVVLISILVPFALAALVIWWVSRQRARVPGPRTRADLLVPPESISPEEVATSSDRVDLLEKRIDQEVRARVTVEERITHMQEDLKVIRDRLNRVLKP